MYSKKKGQLSDDDLIELFSTLKLSEARIRRWVVTQRKSRPRFKQYIKVRIVIFLNHCQLIIKNVKVIYEIFIDFNRSASEKRHGNQDDTGHKLIKR